MGGIRRGLRGPASALRCVQHVSACPRRSSARAGYHWQGRTPLTPGPDGLVGHFHFDGRRPLGIAQAAPPRCVTGRQRRCTQPAPPFCWRSHPGPFSPIRGRDRGRQQVHRHAGAGRVSQQAHHRPGSLQEVHRRPSEVQSLALWTRCPR